MNGNFSRRIGAALFAVAVAGACSKGGSSGGAGGGANAAGSRSATGAKTDDSAAGTVDLGGSDYKVQALSAVGSVGGTITLDGGARSEVIPVPADQPLCGKSVEGPVVATAKGLSNAVVWIADMKAGKRFPVAKRGDLSSEDCILDPRVQAAVVGTTINVTNDDKLLHRLIFTTMGTHDTLTVMPFFNNGQVVASERLARKSGVVEVRCAIHPWTHAYLAVFDHPYFAVTGPDGAFKIDSLPPGSYKLMVWHEGVAKPVEQPIQVAANGAARADVTMKIGPTVVAAR